MTRESALFISAPDARAACRASVQSQAEELGRRRTLRVNCAAIDFRLTFGAHRRRVINELHARPVMRQSVALRLRNKSRLRVARSLR